jgi:ectoine hydroxylase-related dioxygenase (phytanoyl-CoA dioxygenase family)
LEKFFSDDEVAQINAAMDDVWADQSLYNPLTISAFTGTDRYTETYLRCVAADAREPAYKLNHLYLYRPDVLRLLSSPAFTEALCGLLGGSALLFNGLNMERGTEQRFHFDTFYMPPAVPNKMVASWIALEDVHPDSGPLQYYPGSHLIEPYRFSNGKIWAIAEEMPRFDEYIQREIAERGLKAQQICPQKGDVFIWHAQLYHGGSPIKDRTRTRRSMVNHFWRAEDYPPETRIWIAEGFAMYKPRYMYVPTAFSVIS